MRFDFLGLPLDALSMTETVDRLDELITARGPHQHVVLNAAKVVAALDDPELRAVISSCDVVNADGMAVVWAARLLGMSVPERVAGIDLMERLLERAAARGWRVFFLGARREVVAAVADLERSRHPGLNVVGWMDGYWDSSEQAVEAVNAARADVLFVALPSPKKERFLARNLPALGVALAVGVGGSFDVVAGVTRRAPVVLQKAGFEWLYRMAQEPRRMVRRYAVGNTRFVLAVGAEYLRRRRERRR